MELLLGILEIIKYIVPAAVVYFLMKRFQEGQQTIEHIKLKASQKNETLPLRFQAYERLSLLLERMKISSQVMRLTTPSSNASDLKKALLISIQKEFEHNLTQQIYISEELWQIVELAKNNTLNYVNQAYESANDSLEQYTNLLIQGNASHLNPIISNAQKALRKEVELYFI
ncbi:MAG: hypothetical protein V3V00_08615 [Saprospiraceae bacterium]